MGRNGGNDRGLPVTAATRVRSPAPINRAPHPLETSGLTAFFAIITHSIFSRHFHGPLIKPFFSCAVPFFIFPGAGSFINIHYSNINYFILAIPAVGRLWFKFLRGKPRCCGKELSASCVPPAAFKPPARGKRAACANRDRPGRLTDRTLRDLIRKKKGSVSSGVINSGRGRKALFLCAALLRQGENESFPVVFFLSDPWKNYDHVIHSPGESFSGGGGTAPENKSNSRSIAKATNAADSAGSSTDAASF